MAKWTLERQSILVWNEECQFVVWRKCRYAIASVDLRNDEDSSRRVVSACCVTRRSLWMTRWDNRVDTVVNILPITCMRLVRTALLTWLCLLKGHTCTRSPRATVAGVESVRRTICLRIAAIKSTWRIKKLSADPILVIHVLTVMNVIPSIVHLSAAIRSCT